MFRFRAETRSAPTSRTLACALRRAIALAVVVVAAGCGGDPEVEITGDGGYHRLIDIATEVAPADREIVVLAEHRVEPVPLDESPLIGMASNGSVITKVRPSTRSEDPEDFLPAFVVRGEGPKRITYPVDFVRGDLTTIVTIMSCYGSGSERARIALLDEELSAVERTKWIEIERRREPRSLQFDIPESETPDARMGGIRIEIEGRGKHAGLVGIELQSRPPASLLPKVGEGRSVVAGSQSRTSAGLIEGAGWRASFTAAGALRLHLSLHWPLAVRRGEARPKIVVTVDGASGSQSIDKAMPREVKDEWVDMDIDFSDVAAGPVTVSIDVEDRDDEKTAALLVGDAVISTPRKDAPTVLLITSDTHRADHLGTAFTRKIVDTPALDALADRGLLFTDCQSTTNVTNPSHIAVMTGINPRDTQIVDNKTELSGAAVTLAEQFQAAGYRTFAAISTQHLGPDQSGLGQGFDRFETTDTFKRRGEEAVTTVQRWIEGARGEPVFAWVHIFDAHAPYEPPEEAAGRYYDGDGRDPSRTIAMDGTTIPRWIRVAEISDSDFVQALYRAEVDTLDESLSGLLALERVRNGHVAFTSDHGESFGTRGIWFDHAGLYFPNLQVPLILTGPGLSSVRTEAPVQQVDVGRTLLELSGIQTDFPGRNLAEVAAADPIDEPRFSIAAHGLQAGVTSDGWLLVLDLRTFASPKFDEALEKGRVQLFDRRRGVDSSENSIDGNFERAKRMRAALIAWLEDSAGVDLGTAVELTAAATANLEALGYGGYTDKTGSLWWTEEDVDPKWLTPFED